MSTSKIKELQDKLIPMGLKISEKVAKGALFFSRNKVNDEAFNYAISRATPIPPPSSPPPAVPEAGPSSLEMPIESELVALDDDEQFQEELRRALLESARSPAPAPSQAGPSSLGILTEDELAGLDEKEILRRALQASEESLVEMKESGKHKEYEQVEPFKTWINKQIKPISVAEKERVDNKHGQQAKEQVQRGIERRETLKRKLNDLFAEGDWDVIDPVGDGFCTIYAAFIDQGNSEIMAAGKEQLINLIIQGMQKYFKVRKNLEAAGIKPPKEMNDEFYIIIQDNDTLKINEHIVQDVPMITQRLQPLRGLGNTPIELLNFISYALNRNYLMLVYDSHAQSPEDAYSIHYFPCYADFFKHEETGAVVYPYEDSTTLLYNNGHTFLFHNKNSEIKLDIINRLKQNPQLWVQDKRVKITGGKLNKTVKSRKYNKKTKTKKSRKRKITKKRKQNKKRKMTKKR